MHSGGEAACGAFACRNTNAAAMQIPDSTREWLTSADEPAVATLALRHVFEDEPDRAAALWARRNESVPVARILELMHSDGSWAPPARDYQKYWGSLWQIHLLGELHADGSDPRVATAADYAFSRQLPDGSWSSTNMRAAGSIPCLTANVGRALARLGYARDERVVRALGHCVDLFRELGCPNCRQGVGYQLNGYCHMLTPKLLLFLAEVPRELWPDGASDLRDACITALREKRVFQSLPAESREFQDLLWSAPAGERDGLLERFRGEHPDLHFGVKPGWLRFGYPLSYNSDALEALHALALHDEPRRPEYEEALAAVRKAADAEARWTLRQTFNGKMLADVETKGQPSRWLTWRALVVLKHFGE